MDNLNHYKQNRAPFERLELFLWPVSLNGENSCLARRRPGFEPQTDHNMKNYIQLVPPTPPTGHKACSRPNPPWWCGEQPGLSIDVFPLLIIAIIFGYRKIKNYAKK